MNNNITAEQICCTVPELLTPFVGCSKALTPFLLHGHRLTPFFPRDVWKIS